MVDHQPHPQSLQSYPKCMNRVSKSWTSRVATYFKMISGFCISRDWTHFLPPKLIKVTILVLKKWHFVWIITRPACFFLWMWSSSNGDRISIQCNSFDQPMLFFWKIWLQLFIDNYFVFFDNVYIMIWFWPAIRSKNIVSRLSLQGSVPQNQAENQEAIGKIALEEFVKGEIM